MKILIASFGTRGDIQPYVALGKGLRERGHDVAIAVPDGFRDITERAGLRFHPAGSRMLTLLQEVMPQLSGATDALKTFRIMRDSQREHMDDLWGAAQTTQPDLMLYHPKCLAIPSIAEKLGVPGVLSLPLPFYTPTRAFPIPFLAGFNLGGWANRASYQPFIRMAPFVYRGMVNDFRRDLGLRSVSRFADPLKNPDGTPVHVLYPYSRHLVPVPDDYPPTAHVTGYWFLDDEDWQPTPDLLDFLDAGEPPVYIGFGSMGFGRGADERRDAVFSAFRANHLRGIVATGWGGIAPGESSTDDVLVVDAVPHDWLFPRVTAVVHHGGAGSTAAGLRAGRPTLVCAFLGDQPFWGARVNAVGAGPVPLSPKRLTSELSARLGHLVRESGYARRASELGALIRAEDGVEAGIAALERLASSA